VCAGAEGDDLDALDGDGDVRAVADVHAVLNGNAAGDLARGLGHTRQLADVNFGLVQRRRLRVRRSRSAAEEKKGEGKVAPPSLAAGAPATCRRAGSSRTCRLEAGAAR